MDWLAILINGCVSVGVGLLLWAFLPRGATLTRELIGPDTWRLRNTSAVPVRILSARMLSPSTYNAQADKIEELDLPWDGTDGVNLTLDDETEEIARADWQRPWSQVEIPPGDTITARVPTNTTLSLRYRRSGWSGWLERRRIAVHGGV